jgi:hypothetical protein
MFCCGGNTTVPGPKCDGKDKGGCLPKFLTFTSTMLPPVFSGRAGGQEMTVAIK